MTPDKGLTNGDDTFGAAPHERPVPRISIHAFCEFPDTGAALQRAGSPRAAAEADDLLGLALGRLFAVAEAYPELKASENFLRLQEDLTDTEDKISAARRYYNATVRDLNTKIKSFPNVLVARPMGFSEEEFYTDTDASIQTAPVVKFGAAKA